ncbi:MAG: hypothetical protein OIF58_08480 [Cohaesibacter sp.]|nr:hypothetical protein [Cohaesibacter sp.]
MKRIVVIESSRNVKEKITTSAKLNARKYHESCKTWENNEVFKRGKTFNPSQVLENIPTHTGAARIGKTCSQWKARETDMQTVESAGKHATGAMQSAVKLSIWAKRWKTDIQ